jgi:hypothetical protein
MTRAGFRKQSPIMDQYKRTNGRSKRRLIDGGSWGWHQNDRVLVATRNQAGLTRVQRARLAQGRVSSHGASAPDAWSSRVVANHIRTNLHPRSICIGETGFLGLETNRPNWPSGQKRSPRRPKRSRKSPPIAGLWLVSGKSSGSKDCVVGLGGLKHKARSLWIDG